MVRLLFLVQLCLILTPTYLYSEELRWNKNVAYFRAGERISHNKIGLEFVLPVTSKVAVSRRGSHYEMEAYTTISEQTDYANRFYLFATDYPAPEKDIDPPPFLFSPCKAEKWNGKKRIDASCEFDKSGSQVNITVFSRSKTWHLLILYLSREMAASRDEIIKSVKLNPEFALSGGLPENNSDQ